MYRNLLTLVFAVTFLSFSQSCFSEQNGEIFDANAEVLKGENSIESVDIEKDKAGVVKARISYFFTGRPLLTYVYVEAKIPEADKGLIIPNSLIAKRGKNSIELEIKNPRFLDPSVLVSQSVKVAMTDGPGKAPFIEKNIPYVIEWDSQEDVQWRKKIAVSSNDQLYQESVKYIDDGFLPEAKRNLEHIILNDPHFAPAYLELARVVMKSNWNAQGLAQAESYILTALKINPTDPNSNILLGYVYTHQNRFDEAEKSFKAAEKVGTKNLWLWANWGQLLIAQDKPVEAIKKYMAAVNGSRPYDTYDRARLDAYRNLFKLLNNSSDKEKKDALYKKREEEFNDSCFVYEHASFKLAAFNDYKSAIDLARSSIDRGCSDEEAKLTLGLAYYLTWGNTSDDFTLVSKAKVFYPEGPDLYYNLSKTEAGIKTLKKLIKNGGKIDILGADKKPALGIALFNKDSASAKILISLGADVNATLGEQKLPISFIPLMLNDQNSIALMKESGIDYQKVKFNGHSAEEFMKQLSGFGENGKRL